MALQLYRKTHNGFTLIEVMIVVAVVAILTAIALPSYSEYVRRGHRADARAGLLQAQQWLERAATANGVYPTTLPASLTWSADAGKRYTIGFSGTPTTAAFTLIATRKPASAQAADACGNFTLSNTGEQNVTGGTLPIADCWKK